MNVRSVGFNLETAIGRSKECIFLAFQQGVRTPHAHCLQGRNNDAGASKKCAILFVATFTRTVYFEIPKFFNVFIALSELVSGQLLFLSLERWCKMQKAHPGEALEIAVK